MSQNINAIGNTFRASGSSYRNLALQGLEMEILNQFDFFLGENGDVYAELEDENGKEALNINSITFEFLLHIFAESKRIQLADDEWIIQLIKIERFVLSLEEEYICPVCIEAMEEDIIEKSLQCNTETDSEEKIGVSK